MPLMQSGSNVADSRSGTGPGTTKGPGMSAPTPRYEADALPTGTVDIAVIGGGL